MRARLPLLFGLGSCLAGCGPAFDVPIRVLVPEGEDPAQDLRWLAATAEYDDGRAYTFFTQADGASAWSFGEIPDSEAAVLRMQGLQEDPVDDGNHLVLSEGQVGPVAIGPDTPAEAGLTLLFSRRSSLGRLADSLDSLVLRPAAAPLASGGAALFGGVGADAAEALDGVRVLRVDGLEGAWRFEAAGSMAAARRDAQALLVEGTGSDADGRVLLLGTGPLFDPRSDPAFLVDDESEAALEDARDAARPELWDPADGSSTRFGEGRGVELLARAHHSATVLADGRVLVAGGILFDDAGGTGLAYAQQSVLVDPAAGTAEPGAQMVLPSFLHTATALADGRVLIVGGAAVPGQIPEDDRAEIYDPEADDFSAAGSISPARGEHVAALLDDGRVLVAGGATDDGEVALDDSWMFDPVAGTWSAGPRMSRARWGASIARLPMGRALICGGADEAGAVPGCELFVPRRSLVEADRFVPAHDPARVGGAHEGGVVVPLGSGDFVVAGGVDSGGAPELDLLVYRP